MFKHHRLVKHVYTAPCRRAGTKKVRRQKLVAFIFVISPRGEWAVPGSTAIPGQPAEEPEQAPVSPPSSKNQFNIVVPQWGTYQILS